MSEFYKIDSVTQVEVRNTIMQKDMLRQNTDHLQYLTICL